MMLKRITKRTFYCFILFILLIGVGIYLFIIDMERRKAVINFDNVYIKLSDDKWTTDDLTLTVNHTISNSYLKEFSFDGGQTWTRNRMIKLDHNQKLDIIVRDINNKELKINYSVENIDREGPVILIDNNVQVKQNSKVDLTQFVTARDYGSGLREDVVITPRNIDTSKIGQYSFWVYAIDKLANRTIDQLTINVVKNAPPVLAQSIALNYHNLNLQVGQEQQLSASIFPKYATDKKVVWTSSNPLVASVDGTGNIVALKSGSTTITATTANGLSDISIVIVQ